MDKHKLIIFVVVMVLSATAHDAVAERINLPKDADGWTIFTPSTDTRIVYLSENGNDSTCNYYTADNIGADPFNPSGTVVPCATMAKALSLTRDGYPDWILLKRGQVFRFNLNRDTLPAHSGRSGAEPFLISWWGGSGDLPSWRPASADSEIWGMTFRTLKYIAIANIEIYDDFSDPSSSVYNGNKVNTSHVIYGYTGAGEEKSGLMFEGDRFKNIAFNMQCDVAKSIKQNIFYRNVAIDLNSFAGQYLGTCSECVFEENIWDHNGWYDMTYPEGGDRVRNHNVYLTPGDDTVFKNNILSRPCNTGTKFVIDSHQVAPDDGDIYCHNLAVKNNLYVDTNIAIGGFSNNGQIKHRVKNARFIDNVIINSAYTRPSLQNLAWAIGIDGADGVEIARNLFAHMAPDTDMIRSIGLHAALGDGTPAYNAEPYGDRNLVVHDNIFIQNAYNSTTDEPKWDAHINISGLLDLTGVKFENNIFDSKNNQYTWGQLRWYSDDRAGGSGAILNGVTFSNNTYNNTAKDVTFIWPTPDSEKLTPAQWKAQWEPTAKFEEPAYPDPTRDIPAYMQHIGDGSTLEDFYSKIRGMSRINWDPKFTAQVINDWIRAGYFVRKQFRTGSMPIIH